MLAGKLPLQKNLLNFMLSSYFIRFLLMFSRKSVKRAKTAVVATQKKNSNKKVETCIFPFFSFSFQPIDKCRLTNFEEINKRPGLTRKSYLFHKKI